MIRKLFCRLGFHGYYLAWKECGIEFEHKCKFCSKDFCSYRSRNLVKERCAWTIATMILGFVCNLYLLIDGFFDHEKWMMMGVVWGVFMVFSMGSNLIMDIQEYRELKGNEKNT